MNDLNYLSPILSFISRKHVIIKGRPAGRTVWFIQILSRNWPYLDWDYSKDFCFNPRKIKKISDRKARRVFYQSFSQYKKSFKPRPKPKLKIFKDEWPSLDKWKASMLEATKTAAKRFSDITDAISYAFYSLENFRTNYLCSWDLAAGED